jgi:urease accessory protein
MDSVVLWQLIDSAFPSGGFAHSGGLEAAYQSGEVASEPALRRFVAESLWQAGRATLPLVTSAHRDPSRLEALDALCDAFLTNAVANRASRLQGQTFVAACARIWPSSGIEAVAARARALHGHYAPVFGAALEALRLPLADAQRMALFVASRGILAAAVRLGIVGPYGAQRLQHESTGIMRDVLQRCGTLTDDDLTQTAPILDVLHSSHDRLYSRLFQS